MHLVDAVTFTAFSPLPFVYKPVFLSTASEAYVLHHKKKQTLYRGRLEPIQTPCPLHRVGTNSIVPVFHPRADVPVALTP